MLVGRILSIPISLLVAPSALIGFEFGLCLLSCVALLTVGQVSYWGLIGSVSGIGLGLAALYPGGIVVAKERSE